MKIGIPFIGITSGLSLYLPFLRLLFLKILLFLSFVAEAHNGSSYFFPEWGSLDYEGPNACSYFLGEGGNGRVYRDVYVDGRVSLRKKFKYRLAKDATKVERANLLLLEHLLTNNSFLEVIKLVNFNEDTLFYENIEGKVLYDFILDQNIPIEIRRRVVNRYNLGIERLAERVLSEFSRAKIISMNFAVKLNSRIIGPIIPEDSAEGDQEPRIIAEWIQKSKKNSPIRIIDIHIPIEDLPEDVLEKIDRHDPVFAENILVAPITINTLVDPTAQKITVFDPY